MTYQSFHFWLWVVTHARLFETVGANYYLPYSRADNNPPLHSCFVVGRDLMGVYLNV